MNTNLLRKPFALFLILASFLVLLGPVACSNTTLAPTGVYQGDKILYAAEKATTTAYNEFFLFLKWETTYRAILPVEVSRAADVIRLNAKKWIDSAGALRDAYVAQPTPANRDKLSTAISLIDAALDEAAKYQTNYKAVAPPIKPSAFVPLLPNRGLLFTVR